MTKFIELTHYDCGTKFLVAADKILTVESEADHAYVSLRVDGKSIGTYGYSVVECYEYVKCRLIDIFYDK